MHSVLLEPIRDILKTDPHLKRQRGSLKVTMKGDLDSLVERQELPEDARFALGPERKLHLSLGEKPRPSSGRVTTGSRRETSTGSFGLQRQWLGCVQAAG